MITKKELCYFLGDENHDDEYTYYVDYKDVYDFIAKKFANEYTIHQDTANNIIGDLDLWDTLEEQYEDDILENWMADAMAQREDDKAYQDKYSYYGVSQSDFI